MDTPIRCAVIGVGHLGRFHAQKYHALATAELVGVVDTDPERAKSVAGELGVKGYTDYREIIDSIDAASIAVPTGLHAEVAKPLLEAGKHLLVEKPLTTTAAEGEGMVALAKEKGVVLHVGYLERFNPAIVGCRHRIVRPQFIESLRIASFKGRGADVDVVLDLMSHDLDLLFSMVKAPVTQVHAIGISLVTPRTDMANARIIFSDGCVADLTASRISTKEERQFRLFQKDAYFSLDLSKPSAKIYSNPGEGDVENPLTFNHEELPVEKGDALYVEITEFLDHIKTGKSNGVTGQAGLQVTDMAEKIIENIAKNRLPT